MKKKDLKNLSNESPEKIERNDGFNSAVLTENDYEVDPMFSADTVLENLIYHTINDEYESSENLHKNSDSHNKTYRNWNVS